MKMTVKWSGLLLAFIVLVVAIVLIVDCCVLKTPARAHDSWISKGGHKNAAGEWCCGEGDCGALDAGSVRVLRTGYRVRGFLTVEGTKQRIFVDEIVPFSEAQPTPDGQYWRCHRPDGSRRCFFAPPPSY